jgi:hypothetical protein
MYFLKLIFFQLKHEVDAPSYKMFLSAIVGFQKKSKSFDEIMEDFVTIFKAKPESIRFLRGARSYIVTKQNDFDDYIKRTFEFF